MITKDDLIPMEIPAPAMRTVYQMAKAACIGGHSHIRGDNRQEKLMEDQLVGQIGQYIGSQWLYGSPRPYLEARYVANKNPTVGDGGSDIIGSNLDFKASLVRHPGRDPLEYRLAVRPRERHQGWVYMLVLVTHLTRKQPVKALLVGWASDRMLPQRPEDSGVFKGAFTINARDLHPVPPITWWQ